MPNTCRVGMITPSSNTVLEPVTAGLVSRASDTTAHFTRVPVRRIALDDDSNTQFASDTFVAAAELLAHARVDVVAWNGTSGSWLGPDTEDEVCAAIESTARVPVTTATRAILAALSAHGVGAPGLITPYTPDVGEAICETYARAGHPVRSSVHLGLSTNFDFAGVDADQLTDAFDELVAAGCDGVSVVCTNVSAANLVTGWEERTGVLVVDSVCATLWHALQLANRTRSVPEAGRLLNGDAPARTAGA